MIEKNTQEQPEASLPERKHFIQEIIEEDLKNGKNNGNVQTRFPPEPNGYLHIGHAKSICLNFGLAKQYNGKCNLRFDDTNPTKEEQEYVDSIKQDVQWLGFEWNGKELFASDYFHQLYDWAVLLIKKGKAFVCDLSGDEIRKHRGTLTEPGKESPFRNRSIEENLDLFERMKKGEFPDGTRTLRAKIDMQHPNINMRDPIMYRILHAEHHRTGNEWCVYPMYDWAHGQSDSIEGVTHSICTLEFEDHRPLYDWYIEQLGIHHPRQIEFARLNLTYTVMSKRKLLQLVEEGVVNGWDDPRMPTISGFRRRGYTPESIRYFADKVGVAKRNNMIDVGLLEHSIREDLNKRSARMMAVLRPLKVVITNYPGNQVEELEAVNNPEDPAMGSRSVPFSREIYIEQDDFREVPPPKYFRLAPGAEVRLRYAYIIKCVDVIKDSAGVITEIHCTYDPETKSQLAVFNNLNQIFKPFCASISGNVYHYSNSKCNFVKKIFSGNKVEFETSADAIKQGYTNLCFYCKKDKSFDKTIQQVDASMRPQNQRKVKGTIHWVSAPHAVDAEVRLYDRLFTVEEPEGENWKELINPHSLDSVMNCKLEKNLAGAKPQERFQFERLGYFCADYDSTSQHLIFNRTVTLKDTWAKIDKGK